MKRRSATFVAAGQGPPAPQLDRPQPRRRRSALIDWLLVAAVPACIFIRNDADARVGVLDVVLGLIVLIGAAELARHRSPAKSLLARTAFWLWLVLLASVASLARVGVTGWGISSLLADIFSFALFFSVLLFALQDPSRMRHLRVALLLAFLLQVFLVLTGPSYRPAGTMGNPNLTGHFVVLTALFLLVAGGLRAPMELAVAIAAVAVVGRTGSFGSAAMFFGGALYLLWSRFRGARLPLAKLAFALLVVAFLGSVWTGLNRFEQDNDYRLSGGLSSERLDRSAASRFEIWGQSVRLLSEQPLGVGPGGIAHRDLLGRHLEIHNDYLGFLVERGALGLLGLVGVLVTLWKRAPPGGAARVLLVGVMIGGLFRETLHFRHLWLLLALAFAWDAHRRAAVSAAPHRVASGPRQEIGVG